MVTITGAFGSGLTEPVWVLQHLAAFLAIGMLAGQTGGTAVWQVPVAAVTAALAAGLAAQTGVRLPYAAEGMGASLILVGGLVGLAVRAPVVLAVLLAAVAAVFHGYPHQGNALFWAGCTAGFLLVACAGLGVMAVLGQTAGTRAVQLCGGAVAVAGLLDLMNVI